MLFLFPRLERPAGWICARYKSLLLLLLLLWGTREGERSPPPQPRSVPPGAPIQNYEKIGSHLRLQDTK